MSDGGMRTTRDAHAEHKAALLAEHPDWTPEQWVSAALEAAERDFAMVNRLLEDRLHPLTWTPPLVEIAREKWEAHWRRLAQHFADQLVELWHVSDFAFAPPSLHEFMGLTQEQYAAWVECRYEDIFPPEETTLVNPVDE